MRRRSGAGGASLACSSGIGKAAERTLLPPCSMTASVARKSPTSDCETRKFTASPSTRPWRSK
nr:hypothetical protein [Deltaproteobacteria bacterium]